MAGAEIQVQLAIAQSLCILNCRLLGFWGLCGQTGMSEPLRCFGKCVSLVDSRFIHCNSLLPVPSPGSLMLPHLPPSFLRVSSASFLRDLVCIRPIYTLSFLHLISAVPHTWDSYRTSTRTPHLFHEHIHDPRTPCIDTLHLFSGFQLRPTFHISSHLHLFLVRMIPRLSQTYPAFFSPLVIPLTSYFPSPQYCIIFSRFNVHAMERIVHPVHSFPPLTLY